MSSVRSEFGEAADGVLGAAIGRLQRNAPIRQRRSDLDDGAAIAWPHVPKRRHRAVHETEIRHLGDAAEFGRRHLPHRRKNRCHGVVDPYVDASERLLDNTRGSKHGFGIGYIGRGHHSRPAEFLDLSLHLVQRFDIPRDQSDPPTGPRELMHGGPPYPGRCAGDHHDLRRSSCEVHCRSPYACTDDGLRAVLLCKRTPGVSVPANQDVNRKRDFRTHRRLGFIFGPCREAPSSAAPWRCSSTRRQVRAPMESC